VLLLAMLRFIEITIVAVLVRKVLAVSTIFIGVPSVVVVTAFVVVALFLMGFAVITRYGGSDQGGAQYERASPGDDVLLNRA
jgi:hypothetical protein